LLTLAVDGPVQAQSFLIDRKNAYYHVPNLMFPAVGDASKILDNTILDGELVAQTNTAGQSTLRFLAFDLLVLNGVSLTHKPLDKRLGACLLLSFDGR
jgi:hypothetical protein